jgi:trehalose 6-phosphate phosphatase
MTEYHDALPTRCPGLLIVDPDPTACAPFVRAMERCGWSVWVAAGGATALATYRDHRGEIDVALVDLQLPGLEGARVLTELRQLDHDLPCCATSEVVSPYAAAAFRRMSDTPLFTKPLAPRALSFTLLEMIAPVRKRFSTSTA